MSSEAATDGSSSVASKERNVDRPTTVDGVVQMGLIALFVTALITAQVTATKLVGIGLPVDVPLANETALVPAAVGAYAVTFFASDCYAELYGRQAAQLMVNVAFVMNFVLLALVRVAVELPTAADSTVGGAEFKNVLMAAEPIVIGSIVAYIVSQNWDVLVFHRLREYTDGERLWLRNLGSTATSQAIDTLIFITIAFWIAPPFFDEQGLPLAVLPGLILGQYLVKLLIAFGDTPFVYAVVGFVRSRAGPDGTAAN